MPWPLATEPETLGNANISTFPKLGVSDVGKLIEFVATALWDLQFDLLRLYEGLDSLSECAHGLGIVDLTLLQALLVVLLGKVYVSQELGVYFLLDAVSVPFSELVVHGVVPGLGHICTEAHSSQSAWDWKS